MSEARRPRGRPRGTGRLGGPGPSTRSRTRDDRICPDPIVDPIAELNDVPEELAPEPDPNEPEVSLFLGRLRFCGDGAFRNENGVGYELCYVSIRFVDQTYT